jgi:tetratricopeptide (TPR) repeat protein
MATTLPATAGLELPLRGWGRFWIAGALFLVLGWTVVPVIAELPDCWPSPIYLLKVLGYSTVWAMAGLGIAAILRRRPHGLWVVLLAVGLQGFGQAFFSVDERYRDLPLLRFPVFYTCLGIVLLGLVLAAHLLRQQGRWMQSCLLVGLVLLSCLGWWGTGRFILLAKEELHQAWETYRNGRPEEALAGWERIVANHPGSSAWGASLYNLGLELKWQHRYPEAIAHFEKLLASRLDDREGTRNFMVTSQNYHHNACLQLSACYAAQKDRDGALRYAFLARDVYPYTSWCGTCEMHAEERVQRWIGRLERDELNPDDQ